MTSPTNLQRAMVAETTLHDYSVNKEGINKELYDVAESVITDLISDLCHLLYLDEKMAGCMTRERIKQVLDRAYNHFETETFAEEE